MDRLASILLCSFGGATMFAVLVVWLVFYIRSHINPSWKLKRIDPHRGVMMELTNMKGCEAPIKSFHLTVRFPGISGEAHTSLMDYLMRPNEVVEIPMKLYAEKMPEAGTKILYVARFNRWFGFFELYGDSAGRLEVVKSTECPENTHKGIQISAPRT